MKPRILKSNLVLFPFILIFIVFLSIYGIKGWHSRYLADDYCYGYRVNENGLLNNQIDSYFTLTEYASNRFSATLFQNIAEKLGGAYFVRYLPATAIILWLLGLLYLALQIKPKLASKNKFPIALASSLAILFFTLYLAPNLYETLFWLAGMQAYVTPIVFFTILVGRLLYFSKKTTIQWYNILEISILSFLTGGFSETVSLWQIAILLIVFLFAFLYKSFSAIAQHGLKTISIALATMLTSFGILLACPTNSIRASSFPHPDFITLVSKSLFHAKEFTRLSILGKPAPFLAVILFGILFGLLTNESNHKESKIYIYALLVTDIIGFVLITGIMAPTMYAMSTYPGGRTLFPAHFTLVLALFLNGWLISNLIQKTLSGIPILKHVLPFALGAVLLIYSAARITPQVYKNLEQYQSRAQAWDDRHQKILTLQEAGEQNITIPAFESVYQIMAIKDNPNAWVNRCAANYYEAESLYATQNYDGVPTHPIGK